MANYRALVELRKEGFFPGSCDRREGPFTKDLFGFGDIMAYDPTHLRRPRLVNACLADIQPHIRKYLEGGEGFGPNEHLVHLVIWWDLYIYSFVKRTMRNKEGKLLEKKIWFCRKWKAIQSPTGVISFEKETEASQRDAGENGATG